MKKFFSSKLNLVLAIILIILIGVSAFLLVDVFRKEVVVDDFSAYSEKEIIDWAKKNKVDDKLKISYEFDDNIPEGQIVYQSIKEGEKVNDEILIIISKGKNPDAPIKLIENNDTLMKKDVENFFIVNGFNNVYYQFILSDQVEEKVLNISKTGEVKKDEEIIVTCSAGLDEEKVSLLVPDFKTLNKDDISSWAANNKITINYVEQVSTLAEGSVISQNREINSIIHMNEEVEIVIAKGENKQDDQEIVVPDTLLWYKEKDFIEIIEGLGLVPKKGDKTYKSKSHDSLTIYSYDSTSDGKKFKKGDTVNYYLVNNGDVIEVPDTFLWYKEADFIKEIEKLGLKALKDSKTYKSKGHEDGSIYSYQSSSDGIVFKKGDQVKYNLVNNQGESSDVANITVPDNLLFKNEKDFLAELEKLGLVGKKVGTTTSKNYPTGTVYSYDSSSDTSPATLYKKGDTINYKIIDNNDGGQGSETTTYITVPDTLLFKTEADFIKEIEKLGLVPKKAGTKKSNNYQSGTIYSYDSTSDGKKFKAGDVVNYYVVENNSSEPSDDKVSLPNFIGKTKEEVQSFCNSNGLKLVINQISSSDVPYGQVISMSPEAGSKVSVGSSITINYSVGEKTATIVNGDTLISLYSKQNDYDGAYNAINNYFANKGFGNITINGVSSTKTIGVILSVSVNGDTAYEQGSYSLTAPIVIEISKSRAN